MSLIHLVTDVPYTSFYLSTGLEQELMLLTLVKHIKSYLKRPSVFLISICLWIRSQKTPEILFVLWHETICRARFCHVIFAVKNSCFHFWNLSVSSYSVASNGEIRSIQVEKTCAISHLDEWFHCNVRRVRTNYFISKCVESFHISSND